MAASPASDAGRVLVLAPIGRDADSAAELVRRHGCRAETVADLRTLAACIDDDAGAVLITEEALVRADAFPLVAALNRQPTWSDLPFVFLAAQRTGPASSTDPGRGRLPERITNVMLLERPLSTVSLLSALDWALAARRRQFEARDLLARLQSALDRQVEERTAERDGVWNASGDLMAVAGTDGFLRLINPAWSRVVGWPEDELLSRPFLDLLHEEDRPAAAATMNRLAQGETVASHECRLCMADGGHRLIAWAATPGGSVVYLVGRDLTDQRRTEEALRQSQKMEAIGQLTAGIAHDFNNMLTGVIGGLDIIRRRIADGRTDTLDKFLDAATGSAQRAAALTHRLLAFSRRQSLDTRPLDVNGLVGSMEELLARSIGEGTRLSMRLGDNLPVAKADANQLESAVLNLAINARDAMPEGGMLTIETMVADLDSRYASRHDGLKPGRYVVVAVTDTGVGMPPEVLAKVYDPFFTTKPAGEGTGLGLSMVHGFVNQTGGHIRIHSHPGRGTSVKLYLPVAEPSDEAAAEASDEMPMGSGETVLVVEDDPSVRMLVLEVLHELGYRARAAADAKEAMPILASDQRIDLMVSDVGLPGINGRQLAVMARHHRPDLKVLFMTGYAESAALRSGFLEPGMEMIVKPFALDVLAGKIRDAVA
jgi:PAS domain S-box-containing protein